MIIILMLESWSAPFIHRTLGIPQNVNTAAIYDLNRLVLITHVLLCDK